MDVPLPLVRIRFNTVESEFEASRAAIYTGLALEFWISVGYVFSQDAPRTLTFFWRQFRQASSGSPRSEDLRPDILAVDARLLFALGGVLEDLDVSLGDIGRYGKVCGIAR